MLADACVSALVSPRLRLAFACARRRGTQEDLVGLFVAAARGLGLTARVVAAFDPTPHRASASELARLGVRVGDEPPSRGDVEGRRSTRGGDRRRKRKRETSVQEGPAGYGFNSVRCDPSFFARATSDDDTNAEALARERVTWWAEVLCADETEPLFSDETAFQKTRVGSPWRRTPPAFQRAAAGASAPAPRSWTTRASRRVAVRLRVRRFSRVGVARVRGRRERTRRFGVLERVVRATDVTKKYAEAFSRCAEKRGDSEWVAETTRILLPDRGFDVNALVASADARDAREMDARAKTERVPSAMHELKNHPLYACERFLRPNQVIFPRKPVVGFVNGECVFPRSCVSELRSAERWKSEARREVMPEELGKPRARTFSRAARAAAPSPPSATPRRRGRAGRRRGGARRRRHARWRRDAARVRVPLRRWLAHSREAERAMLDGATADANVEGDIPLFGVWQTREWHPPRAVNGIVPNARGERGPDRRARAASAGHGARPLPRVSRVARGAARQSRQSRETENRLRAALSVRSGAAARRSPSSTASSFVPSTSLFYERRGATPKTRVFSRKKKKTRDARNGGGAFC